MRSTLIRTPPRYFGFLFVSFFVYLPEGVEGADDVFLGVLGHRFQFGRPYDGQVQGFPAGGQAAGCQLRELLLHDKQMLNAQIPEETCLLA